MMLTINALIITITMPLLRANVRTNGWLVFPVALLMITCVTSIIFAALTTRPIKMQGKTSLSEVKNRNSNLFFFGNFYNMTLAKYHEGLYAVVADTEVMQRSIMNDLYYLGLALGKKIEQLRVCYLVFMVGMAISVVAFGIAIYLSWD